MRRELKSDALNRQLSQTGPTEITIATETELVLPGYGVKEPQDDQIRKSHKEFNFLFNIFSLND